MLPALERHVRGTLATRRPCDELGEVAVAIRADDEVYLRHPLEQPGPEALGHAAHDAEHPAGAFVVLQLAHAPQHPLLGVVADGAGVDEQHVGRRGIVRTDVSLPRQKPKHQLGVRHVHLAAVRLDVNARHQVILTSKRGRPSQPSVER